MYGTDIQLRASGNCGRAAWFRLNGRNDWNGQNRSSTGSFTGPWENLFQSDGSLQ